MIGSESLAFATEPVLGSLVNLLGNCDRLPVTVQQELKVSDEHLYLLTNPISHLHFCAPSFLAQIISWQRLLRSTAASPASAVCVGAQTSVHKDTL